MVTPDFSLLAWLQFICNAFVYGFVVAVPLFFLLSLVLKKQRELLQHFVHLSGLLLAVTVSCTVFLFVGGMIRHMTWVSENLKNADQLADNFSILNRLTGSFSIFFWLPVLFMLLGSLLWIKKLRRNPYYVLFMVLLALDAVCRCGIVHLVYSWKNVFRAAVLPADLSRLMISLRLFAFPLIFGFGLLLEFLLMRTAQAKTKTDEPRKSVGF